MLISRPAAPSSTVGLAGLVLLACGVALIPLSTKIAGAVWLGLCLWGVAALLHRSAGVQPSAALAATRAWLLCGILATVMAGAALWIWSDPADALHAELRLLMAAVATAAIVARGGVAAPGFRMRAGDAVAASCAVALACIGVVTAVHSSPREFLPANAIVWALAIAFSLCLLLPMVLDAGAATGRRRWWIAAALMGAATVLISQSRGALGIFAWALWLLVEHWRRGHGHWPLAKIGCLAAAAAVVGAALWAMPGDPLRMRQAEQEIVSAETGGGFNTSMGTRLYLWNLAWTGLQDSPWIGIGGTERLRRIKHAGEELPPEQHAQLDHVRTMGHVHNQYLHSALDGGLLGLGAILAVIAGMAAAAWQLRRADALASRQLQGLLFIHLTAGFTNVNFAHNYYAVTLSVAIAIVLLGAHRRAQPGPDVSDAPGTAQPPQHAQPATP